MAEYPFVTAPSSSTFFVHLVTNCINSLSDGLTIFKEAPAIQMFLPAKTHQSILSSISFFLSISNNDTASEIEYPFPDGI